MATEKTDVVIIGVGAAGLPSTLAAARGVNGAWLVGMRTRRAR